jgi:hypothetical protein
MKRINFMFPGVDAFKEPKKKGCIYLSSVFGVATTYK